MQGNLHEIDLRSILQLIELGQQTGVLLVETDGSCLIKHGMKNGDRQSLITKCEASGSRTSYHNQLDTNSKQMLFKPASLDHSQQSSWFVFFLNGHIIYATDRGLSLSRLDDYLRHYRVKVRLDETVLTANLSQSIPEYSYLWALLEQNIINPTQARIIIQGLIHETIFDLLNLRQGNFIFKVTPPLAPLLTTWQTAAIAAKIARQVQGWKQLYPYIQSPDQLPMLSDVIQLRASLQTTTIDKLKQWADGKTSLRQLARYLNRDILTVAKAIFPYVQQGWVKLVYTNTQNLIHTQDSQEVNLEEKSKIKIVCIDNAISVCKSVESILNSQGFEAIALTNPLEALSRTLALKPDLILCDITMPELDGYEICAMLRQSKIFRLSPIILLASQDDFINRTKAQMVGATDYLAKPFHEHELLMLIKKYLGDNYNYKDKNDTRVVDTTLEGVQNNIKEFAEANKKRSLIKFVKE
ncbi:response regulator [Calothrix sp. UHCC 0171]|uniref:response regulator n=1 Tax=Calothrix sp. UHCC 0171 TaxID=3110245 RepID=UPI002B1F998F|nr:response regulator [Calothrix sp. UHCC 0171]MEA5569446.1 response regulator [Calothrix sp. UHCC 0171]